MSTPDTEKCKNCRDLHNGSIVKVDNNGACVFCGRQVSPNITTPDIEWEKEFDRHFLGTEPDGEWGSNEIKNGTWTLYAYAVKNYIRSLLTSRDTYWKERVRKELDAREKELQDEVREQGINFDEHTATRIYEVRKMRDTLLDNLK